MRSKAKQLALWRSPKLWPSQTIEMLLPLIKMATDDPRSAQIAALVRTSVENRPSSSWTGSTVVSPTRRDPHTARLENDIRNTDDALAEDIYLNVKRA